MDTGIVLGNEEERPAEQRPAAASDDTATQEAPRVLGAGGRGGGRAGARGGEQEPCDEPATRPTVAARPNEISYTNHARAEGVEGRLLLELTVGPDGAVTNITVLASVEPALDAAAVAAVQTWRFHPARRCGKPVSGVYKVAQRFELGD